MKSEIQTAIVNLRTAKIQLLQLLNDRTPVEQFDVTGPFDFSDELKPLEDFRQIALDERPDLRAALAGRPAGPDQPQAGRCQWLRRSDLQHLVLLQPTFNNPFGRYTLGASVNVPLRIFDRNQGEKQRTQIDIDRNQQLTEAARAQVFSDVDSAYAQVESNIALLKPYKAKYNGSGPAGARHRDLSYQHGGASLMDFLNAQSDYRTVQLAYLQLIGSYLTAAGQLNLAVGREVIQ